MYRDSLRGTRGRPRGKAVPVSATRVVPSWVPQPAADGVDRLTDLPEELLLDILELVHKQDRRLYLGAVCRTFLTFARERRFRYLVVRSSREWTLLCDIVCGSDGVAGIVHTVDLRACWDSACLPPPERFSTVLERLENMFRLSVNAYTPVVCLAPVKAYSATKPGVSEPSLPAATTFDAVALLGASQGTSPYHDLEIYLASSRRASVAITHRGPMIRYVGQLALHQYTPHDPRGQAILAAVDWPQSPRAVLHVHIADGHVGRTRCVLVGLPAGIHDLSIFQAWARRGAEDISAGLARFRTLTKLALHGNFPLKPLIPFIVNTAPLSFVWLGEASQVCAEDVLALALYACKHPRRTRSVYVCLGLTFKLKARATGFCFEALMRALQLMEGTGVRLDGDVFIEAERMLEEQMAAIEYSGRA